MGPGWMGQRGGGYTPITETQRNGKLNIKGWGQTFLIRAFCLSQDLSTRDGFAFSKGRF